MSAVENTLARLAGVIVQGIGLWTIGGWVWSALRTQLKF
jgi:hypothetical protein